MNEREHDSETKSLVLHTARDKNGTSIQTFSKPHIKK